LSKGVGCAVPKKHIDRREAIKALDAPVGDSKAELYPETIGC
jgi:hypothetical protein